MKKITIICKNDTEIEISNGEHSKSFHFDKYGKTLKCLQYRIIYALAKYLGYIGNFDDDEVGRKIFITGWTDDLEFRKASEDVYNLFLKEFL